MTNPGFAGDRGGFAQEVTPRDGTRSIAACLSGFDHRFVRRDCLDVVVSGPCSEA